MSKSTINTKEIKPGMLVEWRIYDVNTGKVVSRKRARVIEQDNSGIYGDNYWHIHTFGIGSGGGWPSWELHPVCN